MTITIHIEDPENGSEIVRPWTMSDDKAAEMMIALDLALHPWGEPGVVPTDGSLVWVVCSSDDPFDTGTPFGARVEGGMVLAQHPAYPTARRDSPIWANAQFRRRWTPEGPVMP